MTEAKDMFDFLKKDAAPAPAAAGAPAAGPEKPAAKLPLPKTIRDMLLAPPAGCDAMAQLKAFDLQFEVPDELIAEIVSAKPDAYTPEQLEELTTRLPKPESVVEPDPQPLTAAAPTPEPAGEKPAPKKRTRRSSANPKDGDPLTRAERLQLACAMLSAGGELTEVADYVIGGAS